MTRHVVRTRNHIQKDDIYLIYGVIFLTIDMIVNRIFELLFFVSHWVKNTAISANSASDLFSINEFLDFVIADEDSKWAEMFEMK